MYYKFFILFCCLIVICYSINNDYEDYISDDSDNYIDPNDMLQDNYFQIKDTNKRNILVEDQCNFYKTEIKDTQFKFESCSRMLETAKHKLNHITTKMEDRSNQNTDQIDFKSFYMRLLKSVWNILDMDLHRHSLIVKNDPVVKLLEFSFSQSDIQNFENAFNNGRNHLEVNEFFHSNVRKIETTIDDKIKSTWFDIFYDTNLWLTSLGILVFILCLWAFSLCIMDIQRNTRWPRVVAVIFFLLFVFSCIAQWQIMVKNIEAKKRSVLTLQEGNLDKCTAASSYWEAIKIRIMGGENSCEKYYHNILLEATKEVTPIMAISETISLFILLPLQHFGTHIGLFFKNFYDNVPIFFQIPATFVFCFVLLSILFTSFGYGIDLPLWMGGIRPITSSRNNQEINQLLEKNHKQLMVERSVLLDEARQIMKDISTATLCHSQRIKDETLLHPMFISSSNIIEKQLEELVGQRFNSYLENNCKNLDSVDSTGNSESLIKINNNHEFISKVEQILDNSLPSGCIEENVDLLCKNNSERSFYEDVKKIMSS